MEIIFIRHSITNGNLERRYIGRKTDEPLCREGIELLKCNIEHNKYGDVQEVYSSPMKRCIQTANIIYPSKHIHVVKGLEECDFGTFENKNYEELKDDQYYNLWLQSMGKMDFLDGEGIDDFKQRVIESFTYIVKDMIDKNIKKSAIIMHGGSIMSILEKYTSLNHDYYDFQVKNCEGYRVIIDESQWGKVKVIESFTLI